GCWWTRGPRTRSSSGSCRRRWPRPWPRREPPRRRGCWRATITRTSSSRASWRITSAGTPNACSGARVARVATALAGRRRRGYMAAMDGSRSGERPGLAFAKMHGLGNDFVVIDQRQREAALTPALVRAIGDRHFGVGFDQLAEILPGGNATARVRFWNSDGSRAQACGTATRCVTDLLMAETGLAEVTLASDNGLLAGRRRADGLIEVDMGLPHLGWQDIPLAREADTAHLPIEGEPAACSMGNPHCCFFVED